MDSRAYCWLLSTSAERGFIGGLAMFNWSTSFLMPYGSIRCVKHTIRMFIIFIARYWNRTRSFSYICTFFDICKSETRIYALVVSEAFFLNQINFASESSSKEYTLRKCSFISHIIRRKHSWNHGNLVLLKRESRIILLDIWKVPICWKYNK